MLTDRVAGVRLRAHVETDVPRMVEQCRDPEIIRWTTVPVPEGGYSPADAREHLGIVTRGWEDGSQLSWVVEERDRTGLYCGGIDLRLQGDGLAEVGFALHPDARGRRLMSAALRLVRDAAFDLVGLQAVLWRAHVGNWASRRVAAAAGWPCEGRVRRLLPQRGALRDAWVGTLLATDPRTPQPWLDPPVLTGPGLTGPGLTGPGLTGPGLTGPGLTGPAVRLRPFEERDADRVVEACSDPRTQHWLVSLPRSYDRRHALAYLANLQEMAAQGTGMAWCVTDGEDDRCLGSISLEGFGGYARRAEIGYWAHPAARGRGLLTAATRLVTAHAETERLVDSIVIRSATANTASRHVAESAGYREVGVLHRAEPLADGCLADLVVYARP